MRSWVTFPLPGIVTTYQYNNSFDFYDIVKDQHNFIHIKWHNQLDTLTCIHVIVLVCSLVMKKEQDIINLWNIHVTLHVTSAIQQEVKSYWDALNNRASYIHQHTVMELGLVTCIYPNKPIVLLTCIQPHIPTRLLNDIVHHTPTYTHGWTSNQLDTLTCIHVIVLVWSISMWKEQDIINY